MKLERDRLRAKVENLESNLSQIKGDKEEPDAGQSYADLHTSPTKTQIS